MTSWDVTFCVDARDGKCGTRDCHRFLTSSLIEAAKRQGRPLFVANFWDDCKKRTEASNAPGS